MQQVLNVSCALRPPLCAQQYGTRKPRYTALNMRRFAARRPPKGNRPPVVPESVPISTEAKKRADATKALLERRYMEKARAREEMEARFVTCCVQL